MRFTSPITPMERSIKVHINPIKTGYSNQQIKKIIHVTYQGKLNINRAAG